MFLTTKIQNLNKSFLQFIIHCFQTYRQYILFSRFVFRQLH